MATWKIGIIRHLEYMNDIKKYFCYDFHTEKSYALNTLL